MTNGDSNIARSWKCINGLFTACVKCVKFCQTSPQVCTISNAHVILRVSHFYKVASVQSVSCGELPELWRHSPLNYPPHSCNVCHLIC